MSDQPGEPASDLLHALPGLARIAVGAWLRSVQWAAGTTAHAYGRLMQAAVSGESAVELLGDMRDYARDLLAADDRVRGALPDSLGFREPGAEVSTAEAGLAALRERGEELLRQSADVASPDHAHPAYARILMDLAPDEARILRFLAMSGPQPAVDVRGGALPLNATSHMVAPGLQMIGSGAGCRYVDRVPAYLNNLYRLGLIWFSREPLEDPLRYQVLEAQPDVLDALHRAGRGRTVRRSILLTPFGIDFCDLCLPLSDLDRARLRDNVPAAAEASAGGGSQPPEVR